MATATAPTTARLRLRVPTAAQVGVALTTAAIAVLGLALRVHHLRTFDGKNRGTDYQAYLDGVNWVFDNERVFDATVKLQVSFYPPLWFVVGALARKLDPENAVRALASVSVAGWVVRQFLLARFLREAAPRATASRLIVLALHAVLPLSVLMDGKMNPEGLHATLYTLGLYLLWRVERRGRVAEADASLRMAALVGAVSGAALLTKSTSSVLAPLFLLVYGLCAVRGRIAAGWEGAWRRGARPALVALCAWTLVAGWWCGANVVRFGSPLPHEYDFAILPLSAEHRALREPALYRRPLGWALPVETAFLERPWISSDTGPPPNFWTPLLAGTWADYFNRGMCRLRGGEPRADVWDGAHFPTNERCLRAQRFKVRVGMALTLAALAAWAWLATATWRSRLRRGSLALAAGVALPVFFAMTFAWVYPIDKWNVVKPNYLLAVSTALAACLGLALARLEARAGRATWAHAAAGVAVALVGVVVVVERGFGQ